MYVTGEEEEEEAVVPPDEIMIGEVGERWVDEDRFVHFGYCVVLGGGL